LTVSIQVGDKVGVPAQLDVDAAPPLLQHVPRPHQTVVVEHDIDRRRDHTALIK